MSLKPKDFYQVEKFGIKEARPILQREQRAIEFIKDSKTSGKFLDVGCGDGQFLSEVSKHLSTGWKFFGVDYSKARLKQAQDKTPFEYKWCNLEQKIPFDDETFDIVYSGEVIEHLYDPDHMLEECNRVLKKNGLLIITTPNLNTWYNRILFLFGIQPIFYETSTKSAKIGAGAMKKLKQQDVPVGHIRLFNKTSLRDIFVSEGFAVKAIKGADFHSLPKPIRFIDGFLSSIIPGIASNLIIVARKK